MWLRAVLAAGLCTGWCHAQFESAHTAPAPRGVTLAYEVDSGPVGNDATEARVAWSAVVQTPQAAWERLHFGACELEGGSFIRASSVADGQVHILTMPQLLEWSLSTAYFNGGQVLLELVAMPGTSANRVTVKTVEVEFVQFTSRGDPGICGICGADNRVSSTQPGVGRTMPAGCTAALYTPWGCTVSAGHCGGPSMQVIQFNVPASAADCTIVMPSVDDQFPYIRNTGGGPFVPGSDWNVGVTGRNSAGQTVYQRYGVYLPIATQRYRAFTAVDVYGYGLNTTCSMSQTLQDSYSGLTTNPPANQYYYTFSNDIREGNSGSPIVRSGTIIGVVTHCSDVCPPNYGTIVDLPVFADTRRTYCPCPADFNVDGVADFFDYLDFVNAFSAGETSADFNADGTLDFFDYLDFLAAFSLGC